MIGRSDKVLDKSIDLDMIIFSTINEIYCQKKKRADLVRVECRMDLPVSQIVIN